MPSYSGHRRAWFHPRPSARATATARLKAEREGRKMGRWILAVAVAFAAAFWRP